MDLGYCVLRAAARPEPVRARLEVRLEDRLQDQLERPLDHPVGQGGYPDFTEFPVLLRDHHLPDLRRPVFPGPQLSPDVCQEAAHAPGPALDMGNGHPVDAGRPRALVIPDAHPCFSQEVRVADEVEQVTEPAGRILSRPAVQLGLHPPYLAQQDQIVFRFPGFRVQVFGQGAGIPRRIFGHYSTFSFSYCLARCRPSPCDRLSRPPSTTAAPSRPRLRQASRLSAPAPLAGRKGRSGHGRFPRSLLSGQRVRHPALPLRHRHGYLELSRQPRP